MVLSDVFKQIRPCNRQKPYIFISYSSQDKELVWPDVLEFQRQGYNIWLDEKNLDKTKASWKEDALLAIQDMYCVLLVFYVSKSSLTSEACYNELSKTVDEFSIALHMGPVKFIAIDVDEVGNIGDFSRNLYQEIFSNSELSKEVKSKMMLTMHNFMKNFFDSNNEKVRIHPKNEPNRKMNYYEEILASFPDEAHILDAKAETVASTLEDTKAKAEPEVGDRAESDVLSIEKGTSLSGKMTSYILDRMAERKEENASAMDQEMEEKDGEEAASGEPDENQKEEMEAQLEAERKAKEAAEKKAKEAAKAKREAEKQVKLQAEERARLEEELRIWKEKASAQKSAEVLPETKKSEEENSPAKPAVSGADGQADLIKALGLAVEKKTGAKKKAAGNGRALTRLEMELAMKRANSQIKNELHWYKRVAELTDKKLKNACKMYVLGVAESDVIGFWDTTMMGSGKCGFLVTADKIYSDTFKKSFIDLERLESFKVGKHNYDLDLVYRDGVKETLFVASCYMDEVIILLTEIQRIQNGETVKADKPDNGVASPEMAKKPVEEKEEKPGNPVDSSLNVEALSVLSREQLKNAMKRANEQLGSAVTFEFAELVIAKRLQSARDAYAKEVNYEDIVGLWDTTDRKNGKKGFLITTERIYSQMFKGQYINLNRIKSYQIGKENYYLDVTYLDGSKETFFVYSFQQPQLRVLLREILAERA